MLVLRGIRINGKVKGFLLALKARSSSSSSSCWWWLVLVEKVTLIFSLSNLVLLLPFAMHLESIAEIKRGRKELQLLVFLLSTVISQREGEEEEVEKVKKFSLQLFLELYASIPP